MLKKWGITSALIACSVFLAVGCGGESKETPRPETPEVVATTSSTVLSPTAIPTMELEPTSTQSSASSNQQVRMWLLQELLTYRPLDDLVEDVGAIPVNLLGRKITRDQALDDVMQKKAKLSEIAASLEEVPPPPSVKYSSDLEVIHNSLIGAVNGHIEALDSLIEYLDYIPLNGGMPSNLDEAGKCLGEATAKVTEAYDLSGTALDKAEKILLEVSD